MTDTVQLRYRINRQLKKQAEAILRAVDCDPSVAIAMFYRQIVLHRGLPFRPTEYPALEEYGATVADAEAAADAVVRDFAHARPDETFEFSGRL